jgi:hypothetical protein
MIYPRICPFKALGGAVSFVLSQYGLFAPSCVSCARPAQQARGEGGGKALKQERRTSFPSLSLSGPHFHAPQNFIFSFISIASWICIGCDSRISGTAEVAHASGEKEESDKERAVGGGARLTVENILKPKILVHVVQRAKSHEVRFQSPWQTLVPARPHTGGAQVSIRVLGMLKRSKPDLERMAASIFIRMPMWLP